MYIAGAFFAAETTLLQYAAASTEIDRPVEDQRVVVISDSTFLLDSVREGSSSVSYSELP
jgi:hypothetical protein